MEIRTLRYLQAVAESGNVSGAARTLHLTQPTLSRQLSALEDELGCALFDRTHRGLTLNSQGAMLLRYAESILELADKAREEISPSGGAVTGSVRLGAGETMNMIYVARAMRRLAERHPHVDIQLQSGTTVDLADRFARGSLDFLIECEVRPHPDLNVIELPIRDRWGVVSLSGSELATRRSVRAEDLQGLPLILPRQSRANGTLSAWADGALDQANVRAEYNLPLNASILVRGGAGFQLTYEGIFKTGDASGLAFTPLDPNLVSVQGLIWRKAALSKPAQAFLDALRQELDEARPDQDLRASMS